MNITLANGETLVKSWDYAKTKTGKLVTNHSLFLTDKRIVTISENKRAVDRNEIPLTATKTVSASAAVKKNFFTYIKLIFGAIFSLVIIGIPLLIKAIRELKYCQFELTITTSGIEGSALILGAAMPESQTGFFGRLFSKAKKQKIYVDKQTAFQIVDEIGATIIKARDVQNNAD